MKTFVLPLVLPLVLPFLCLANTATQTDWSGGYTSYWPESQWDNAFCDELRVDWVVSPGNLPLCLQYPERTIDHDLGAYMLCTGDFDGDGSMDVAGGSYGEDGKVQWFDNVDGSGTSWTMHTVDPLIYNLYSIDSGDINGDGSVDLCAAQYWSSGAGFVVWWDNSGGVWAKHTVEALGGADFIRTADVDDDGDIDLVVSSEDNGVVWYENTNGGGTAWYKHFVDSGLSGANCVYAEDIDSDGDLDIVGSSYFADCVSWWENIDGQGDNWTEHSVAPVAGNPYSVSAADLDGDGDKDVFSASIPPVSLVWWENTNGIGTSWSEHAIEPSLDWPHSAYAADIDGDGDQDISASTGDGISWWENLNGTGTSWLKHVIDSLAIWSFCVLPDDVDGDGIMDVVATGGLSADLCWWDLGDTPCYPASGYVSSALLYASGDPDWTSFGWTATTPPGTSVCCQVRASDDYENMGAWSDTLFTSPVSLHGLLADNASVFQYKAILLSTDPGVTPVLNSVTVSWNLLGVEGGGSPAAIELLPPQQNPIQGMVSATFALPDPEMVDLTLFDISGRVVFRIQPGEYQAGWHTVQLGAPGPGIYFIRMRAGGTEAVQRVVVI